MNELIYLFIYNSIYSSKTVKLKIINTQKMLLHKEKEKLKEF